MWTRCTNPNCHQYKNYGGRGITVCKRWRKFEAFLADMGNKPTPRHSIDRINNSGNYEPGNCRWATLKQQLRNMRKNRLITYKGETLCLSEWAERSHLSPGVLRHRLFKAGWTIEDALTTPLLH